MLDVIKSLSLLLSVEFFLLLLNLNLSHSRFPLNVVRSAPTRESIRC